MANPIEFKPLPVDPHQELMAKVEAAPREHAEALLVAWDVLQTAHDQGILDLVGGLLSGRDVIAHKLAEAAAMQESVNAMRNAIALGRILAAIDPDMLHRLAKAMDQTQQGPKPLDAPNGKPPSLFRIIRQLNSEDGRRGLNFATQMLVAVGQAERG